MTTAEHNTEEAAIAGVPQRIVAAWANHDADAFASVFTEDGTLILPGVYRKGYDDIRKFMNEAFKGPYRGTQVTGAPLDLHRHKDTAVIVTRGGVLFPGDSEVTAERAIYATWVVVKDNGEWLLTAYQNGPVNVPSAG